MFSYYLYSNDNARTFHFHFLLVNELLTSNGDARRPWESFRDRNNEERNIYLGFNIL